ncbi:hypothetical protein [Candidatus Frankia alpina]|nr:hypothetical protein [Candidatus Frankia alpina]
MNIEDLPQNEVGIGQMAKDHFIKRGEVRQILFLRLPDGRGVVHARLR